MTRTAEGLDAVDCAGVLIANTDIPVPTWIPTVVKPGTTPLPGHEHQMHVSFNPYGLRDGFAAIFSPSPAPERNPSEPTSSGAGLNSDEVT